jgi:hypothetical protein
MNSNFTLGTRLSLALSLTIASCLVANVVKAESAHTNRASVTNLSQTIAKLIDLDPTQQDLITSALHRAIASKENSVRQPVTAGVPVASTEPRPIIYGRIRNPQPSPSPIINGKVSNPKPTPSPIINGIIMKPQR